jgi:CRISPR/Cas system CSM-associated protein Csm3 (group 7 of RAMP superfamily)
MGKKVTVMRNRAEYICQGRNDPYDPKQMLEHPYDFVSLPKVAKEADLIPHDRYQDGLLSGELQLTYEVLSPVHIGSGVFETAAQCGLEGGDHPIRGIARRSGCPIIPGSSWKGAIRARFEAITGSRLVLASTQAREGPDRIPRALASGHGKVYVKITDQRLLRNLNAARVTAGGWGTRSLSPADSVFGCMGYRGRVHPQDATVDGPRQTEPLSVPPLDSPHMHRLAVPGKVRANGNQIEILEVEGRKFYYDGGLVRSRFIGEGEGAGETFELIDYVATGCEISLVVHLESLSDPELGALLIAAGFGGAVGIVRFGGYKSAGLGKVRLSNVGCRLWRGVSTRSWRRPEPERIDIDAISQQALGTIVDVDALGELHQITTMRREA